MRKLLISLLLTAALTACTAPESPAPTEESPAPTDEPTASGQPAPEIPFEAKYVRADAYDENAVYPDIVAIYSLVGLEKYDRTHEALLAAVEGYTDEFFEESYLVIVTLEEPSSSIRHRVDGIGENGEISITRLVPEVGTDDMAQWCIIIELKDSFEPEQLSVALSTEKI